jgi:MFS family permease
MVTISSERSSSSGLRRYLVAAVLVRLADEGARVALVLLALQRTTSAAAGGALVAALLVPHVVAAPAVGLLIDRARRPQHLLAGAAVGFAIALATATAALGRVPLVAVIAVLLVGGTCGPALTGGLISQLGALVSHDALARAFGLDSLTYNVSGILGPALAGLVASLASAATATVALAVAAGAGAVILATLPIHPRTGDEVAEARPRLRDGALVLVHDRVLGAVTIASGLGQLGPGALPVIAVVVAGRLHAPAASGWLMAVIPVGGMLGSLLWTWRPASARGAPRVVMAAMVGIGLPLVLAAGAHSLSTLAALFALSGFFIGPFIGALFTARQAHAPERLRAGIFTLGAGIKTTAAAAGAALAGEMAHAPSNAQLLLAGASPILAGALGTLLLCPRTRSAAGGVRSPASARR